MTQLYAGVGRERITPTRAGVLAGDVLDTDAEVLRVHRDLYAQSLFLTDRTARLVLITVDVCKVSAAMVEAVVTKLGDELDLPAAAIMIAASHTHSAPHTIEQDAVPGTFDSGFAQQAATGMIASALQAAGKLEPVTLRYERGQSDLGVNKRVSTPWGVLMRANPAGDYDPEVGVLVAERAAGEPVAVLCCYASHPIGHLRSEISSDLTGFLREELEAAFPNCMGFHALGCAGDVSPRMRWEGTDYEIGNPHTGAGRRLLPERTFKTMMEVAGKELASKATGLVNGGGAEPFAGPLSATVATVELPLSPPLSLAQVEAAASLPLNHLHANWAERMRAKHLAGEQFPRSVSYPIQVWRIADRLCVIALGGEVLSSIGLRIRAALSPHPCLTIGHANEYRGYVPTGAALREGGYEAESFYNTMLPAPYATEIDDVLVAAAVNLARGAADGPTAA